MYCMYNRVIHVKHYWKFGRIISHNIRHLGEAPRNYKMYCADVKDQMIRYKNPFGAEFNMQDEFYFSVFYQE